MFADAAVHVGDFDELQLAERTRNFHNGIQIAHVNKAVAIGSRHLVVYLGHYKLRLARGGEGSVHAHAKTAKTVAVRRRDLYQGYVNRHLARLEQIFNLAEKNGRIVRASFVHCLAHVAADEHGVMPEVPFHLWRDIIRASHGQKVDDFHVAHKRPASHKCLDQCFRFGATRVNVHPHVGLDALHGIPGTLQLAAVLFLPAHGDSVIASDGQFSEALRSNRDASKDRAARPHPLTFVLVNSTLVTPSHSIVTFNPICTAYLRTPAQPPDLLLHSWYIVVSSFRHVIQPEPFSAGNIRLAFTALVPAKRVS